jgi:hypothetical protein
MPTFPNQPFHIPYPTFSTAVTLHTYPPMKMEQTECSETLAFKLQTPGNNPEESRRHSKHGESLKSRAFLPSALTCYNMGSWGFTSDRVSHFFYCTTLIPHLVFTQPPTQCGNVLLNTRVVARVLTQAPNSVKC